MTTFGGLTPRTLSNSTWTGTFPRTQATYATGQIVVPVGALDHWLAYRRTKGAARGEIIGFGDSTMHGAGGPPPYAWLQRIRDRAISYGFTDGGKGIFGAPDAEIVYDAPEVNGDGGGTGFNDVADGRDILGGAIFYDTGLVANRTRILQFRGTSARLWYVSRAGAGEFTYSLDGGAPVTIDAHGTNGQQQTFVYLSGLSTGVTHTVTITNLASRTATPPASTTTGTAAGGTFAAGTYYFQVTYVYGGGETLPSPTATVTVGASGTITVTVPDNGQASIKLYRATSVGGPFNLVTSATYDTSAGNPRATDTGGAVDSLTHPPVTGTTNRNLTSKECWVALAGMYDTGFTTQKYAVTGQIQGNFNTVWPFWEALGLTYNGGSMTDPASFSVDTTIAAAGRVKPILAMMELGFNDLTSDAVGSVAKATLGVQTLAACCKAAGCDGMILSGQLPLNNNWVTNGAAQFNAYKNAALTQGLAWVDLFYPVLGPSLSYAGGPGSPHLAKSSYVSQADYLWDNLLGVS